MQGQAYVPMDKPDPDAEAIREFNEVVVRDQRVETVTMPVRDGISLVRLRNQGSYGNGNGRGANGGAPGMRLAGMHMSNTQAQPERPSSLNAVRIGHGRSTTLAVGSLTSTLLSVGRQGKSKAGCPQPRVRARAAIQQVQLARHFW